MRDSIAEDLARMGMYLSFGLPLTGLVITNRAERAADGLAMLAEHNPAVMRLLKAVSGVSIYAQLGFVVADVAVAAGVERGVIPLDHPMTMNIRTEIGIVQATLEAQAKREQASAQARDGDPQPV